MTPNELTLFKKTALELGEKTRTAVVMYVDHSGEVKVIYGGAIPDIEILSGALQRKLLAEYWIREGILVTVPPPPRQT